MASTGSVMSAPSVGSRWYSADQDHQCSDPLGQAYKEAKTIFSDSITSDKRKREDIGATASLDSLRFEVNKAQLRYEKRQGADKLRSWLARFSSCVCFYGNIMDVLVQHHPEYVALAWGAMKFMFVVIQSHEAMLKYLVKGLCRIADVLPRTELVAVLFPTTKMQIAVAELYARVLRFLFRARDWFQGSRLRHALQSVAHPGGFRFADLIEEIEERTRTVDSLASAGTQAEQRDIHIKIDTVMQRQQESDSLIVEVKELLINHKNLLYNCMLNTRQQLSDLQFCNAVDFISAGQQKDALKVLRDWKRTTTRHWRKNPVPPRPFWRNAKFDRWKKYQSSLIVVKGSHSTRFEIKNFCVNLVELLQNAKKPVIWAFKSDSPSTERLTANDVLKQLVKQALILKKSTSNQQVLSVECARFRVARTAKEWLELLESVLDGFDMIFIIIDLEIASHCPPDPEMHFNWMKSIFDLFHSMAENGSATIVKVVCVTYGSSIDQGISDRSTGDYIIPISRGHNTLATRNGSPLVPAFSGRLQKPDRSFSRSLRL